MKIVRVHKYIKDASIQRQLDPKTKYIEHQLKNEVLPLQRLRATIEDFALASLK